MQWFGLEQTLQVISLWKPCLHCVSSKAEHSLSSAVLVCGQSCGGGPGGIAQGQDALLVPEP